METWLLLRSYTRGDQFKEMPAQDIHQPLPCRAFLDYIDKQARAAWMAPKGLQRPEFVDVFKKMGVDIVHLPSFTKALPHEWELMNA